ncbi:MAG: hypothetical protein IT433_08960 [Phycisphaerales bacterium]|nr:hypothetical protein [Phycisphaerales bacterium]
MLTPTACSRGQPEEAAGAWLGGQRRRESAVACDHEMLASVACTGGEMKVRESPKECPGHHALETAGSWVTGQVEDAAAMCAGGQARLVLASCVGGPGQRREVWASWFAGHERAAASSALA